MNRSRSLTGVAVPASAVLLGVVAAFAVLGGGVLGSGQASPSPVPSASPGNSPTAIPTVTPPAVTPSPTPPVGVFDVDLENASGHDVSVSIDDETGTVVAARSGQPGDGMSVRWNEVKVEQVDANTIRLTWEAFTRDEDIQLSVTKDGNDYRISLIQALPYPNTDAMGQDLILVLEFDGLVSAADVEATIESNNPRP
jgi:hypothetical protein